MLYYIHTMYSTEQVCSYNHIRITQLTYDLTFTQYIAKVVCVPTFTQGMNKKQVCSNNYMWHSKDNMYSYIHK